MACALEVVALTHLLSDQVSEAEIAIIMRELDATLRREVLGDVVEFGCYVGTTSVHMAARLRETGRQLYLYDSFAGLPEKTGEDQSPAGMQFTAGALQASRKQLIHNLKQARVPMPRIVKGWFSDLSARDVPEQIAFAFFDGDYYHSIIDPLRLVTPYFAPGATIIVDDYANEALPGAARALDEWLKEHDYRTKRVEASLAIVCL